MWKIIFTGTVFVAMAFFIGFFALVLRTQLPWASAIAATVDVGVVMGGLKVVLDTTKTANELRKMNLDITKLKLEIEEKKSAAEKAEAYVTVATLEEIEKYTPIHAKSKKEGRGYLVGGVVTSVIFIVILGIIPISKKEPFAPPSQTVVPPPQHLPAPLTSNDDQSGDSHNPIPDKPSTSLSERDAAIQFYLHEAHESFQNGDYCKAVALYKKAQQLAPLKDRYKQDEMKAEDGCSMR